MNAMALFPPYVYFIFTYFVVIFYIYPELTTVKRSVKSPHQFENNVEKRQKKCLGRCVSPGCDWLVIKIVKIKYSHFECPHCNSTCVLVVNLS